MKKLLTLFLALCFTLVSLSAQESDAAKQSAADEIADQLRNNEVEEIVEPIEDIDTAMQVEPETTDEAKIEEVATIEVSTPTATDSKRCFEWNYFTPRANLLYWLVGMMNLGVEYKKPESNFGFLVNGGYSPFGDTKWYHNLGGWFVAPEVRYYFLSNEQWFVGAQFLAAGYNYKLSDRVGRRHYCLFPP